MTCKHIGCGAEATHALIAHEADAVLEVCHPHGAEAVREGYALSLRPLESR